MYKKCTFISLNYEAHISFISFPITIGLNLLHEIQPQLFPESVLLKKNSFSPCACCHQYCKQYRLLHAQGCRNDNIAATPTGKNVILGRSSPPQDYNSSCGSHRDATTSTPLCMQQPTLFTLLVATVNTLPLWLSIVLYIKVIPAGITSKNKHHRHAKGSPPLCM